jgi:hypothetical protein
MSTPRHSPFVDTLFLRVKQSKEEAARAGAKAAAAANDIVGAAHHEARAQAFYDASPYVDTAARREIEQEVLGVIRESLTHPDPAVRQSARQGLEHITSR